MSHNRLLDQFQNMGITVTASTKKELDTQLDEGIGFLLCSLRLRREEGIPVIGKLKTAAHPQPFFFFFL